MSEIDEVKDDRSILTDGRVNHRKVRIGIDVGGTFTDAAAIDADTLDVIGVAKVQTTHTAADGVAAGIVQVLRNLMDENNILPEDVVFIAHGTTQATNALLEGDVARVGILGLGNGVFSDRMKENTHLLPLELAPGRFLDTVNAYVEVNEKNAIEDISTNMDFFRRSHVKVVVATEAFGVWDERNEEKVATMARMHGFLATTGSGVSKRYGLRVRTRTAAVNASLIPKMLETARMTMRCVAEVGIKVPLMIMRCDGGVMTTTEMETKPILTLLSGLSAGVAGALMYEKVSTGIFIESGGTSTDISAIKDGQVIVKSAEVGGNKLYLSALDVHTRGVAGGSMIRLENGLIAAVGPRSAHIAGLPYDAYGGEDKEMDFPNAHIELVAPMEGDKKEYVTVSIPTLISDQEGVYTGPHKVALTLAGAANVLGIIPEGEYGYGNRRQAVQAWRVFGDYLGMSAKDAAMQALDCAVRMLGPIIMDLIKTYDMGGRPIELIGGGGSASVIVPYLGRRLGFKYRIAKNAPIISTIGVAMAMQREVAEQSVINPTSGDIRAIRLQVKQKLIKDGANPDSIEITVEVDKQNNILRAIGVSRQNKKKNKKPIENASMNMNTIWNILMQSKEIPKIAEAANVPESGVHFETMVDSWAIYSCVRTGRRILGRFYQNEICVMDGYGVIRLLRPYKKLLVCKKYELRKSLTQLLDQYTDYTTVGGTIPLLFCFYGEKQIDLTGLCEPEHIDLLLQLELEKLPEDAELAVIVVK